MPTDPAARSAMPGDPRQRRRTAVTVVLSVLWFAAIVYTTIEANDLTEIVLDLVVLVLGVLLAVSAAGHLLGNVRLRLRAAERRVEVMSVGDQMAWECDARGKIVFIGDQAFDYFGYTPEELRGTDLSALVHPQEVERLGTVLVEGGGWTEERWRCITKDGSERWFVGTAVPHRAGDGRLLGFLGTARPLGKDALDEQRLSEVAGQIYDRLDAADISPVFQPILSVQTGRLIGAEGLSRFAGSDRSPDLWFMDAAEVGLGVELELLALRNLLVAAQSLPDDLYISLNASPQTLVRAELLELLLTCRLAPDRVVLEITEHASITEYDEVLAAVSALRAIGVRLAVDDAGAGYSSFRHILRLAPEIIKLDRSLIAGLHEDPALRALASAVVRFGIEMGSTVTAEGIETPEELRCAQTLGIHGAQGYLFGRPVADWSTWAEWHARGAVYSVTAAGMATPAA